MNAEEIEIEPIPGLPEELPPGESILWQGRPAWRPLARGAFKIRWLAVYFAIFLAARIVTALAFGAWSELPLQLLTMAGLFSASIGICFGVSFIQARATIYTITTHRVVMRIGAALPMTWNLPFRRIAAADLMLHPTGEGDLILRLVPEDRIAWLHLWPHARAGKKLRACPTLRAIPEPEQVAAILGEAVAKWSESLDVRASADAKAATTELDGSAIRVERGLDIAS